MPKRRDETHHQFRTRISKQLREVIEEAEQRGELLTISEAGAEASSDEDDSFPAEHSRMLGSLVWRAVERKASIATQKGLTA